MKRKRKTICRFYDDRKTRELVEILLHFPDAAEISKLVRNLLDAGANPNLTFRFDEDEKGEEDEEYFANTLEIYDGLFQFGNDSVILQLWKAGQDLNSMQDYPSPYPFRCPVFFGVCLRNSGNYFQSALDHGADTTIECEYNLNIGPQGKFNLFSFYLSNIDEPNVPSMFKLDPYAWSERTQKLIKKDLEYVDNVVEDPILKHAVHEKEDWYNRNLAARKLYTQMPEGWYPNQWLFVCQATFDADPDVIILGQEFFY